ncbi:MAG: cytidine deaminase [Bacteroidetes bacterium]|nr:cytidine deaminase [Bacteroidota bacterium]MBL0066351.1 cytidine deaminase [Bacteroidota bacterium]MBL0138997.1 cytidine deaminase [Bacteroidota bacterium]
MKKVEILSEFEEYSNISELPDDDQRLVVEARLSVNKAYAPYSRFQVGAAVLLENGIVMRGNNQENASYPIGLCAERVAIFAAGANYPGVKIKAIAITAMSDLFHIDKPITPCGACRQAIAEYEHRYHGNIRLIMVGETGKVLVSNSISQFLPYQFTADDLNLKRS